MSAPLTMPRQDRSFIPDILAFGTHQDVLPSLEAWVNTQWDNVWPKTDEFRFNLKETHVLASDDGSMAVVIAPWTSIGYDSGGKPFDRPGRATMIFHRSEDRWLGRSLPPIVESRSGANKPRRPSGQGSIEGQDQGRSTATTIIRRVWLWGWRLKPGLRCLTSRHRRCRRPTASFAVASVSPATVLWLPDMAALPVPLDLL